MNTPLPDFTPMPTTRIECVEQAIDLARLMPESDPIRLDLLRCAAKVWVMGNSVVGFITSEEKT